MYQSLYSERVPSFAPASVFSETLSFSGGRTTCSESPCQAPGLWDSLVGRLVSGTCGGCTLQNPGSGNLQPVDIPRRRLSPLPEGPQHSLPCRASRGLLGARRLHPEGSGVLNDLPVREQLCLTSPPKPAKASLKQSLEVSKNLDLEPSSFCDVDYTICCCHPLISLCLSGFRFQHSHQLGSFPHLIPNTVASSRDYSVGRLSANSIFPPSRVTDPFGVTGFSGGGGVCSGGGVPFWGGEGVWGEGPGQSWGTLVTY